MSINKTLAAFAIAASAFSLNASAGMFDNSPKLYGTPAPASSAQRSIDINAATKRVNVTNGETITFNINGKQFTWKFDLYHHEGALELSFILPQDLQANGVQIYVAEDPAFREMYRN